MVATALNSSGWPNIRTDRSRLLLSGQAVSGNSPKVARSLGQPALSATAPAIPQAAFGESICDSRLGKARRSSSRKACSI